MLNSYTSKLHVCMAWLLRSVRIMYTRGKKSNGRLCLACQVRISEKKEDKSTSNCSVTLVLLMAVRSEINNQLILLNKPGENARKRCNGEPHTT